MIDQVRQALILSWFVVSTVVFLILIAPFLLPEELILSGARACSIEHTETCPLCGMTKSFLSISHGQFDAAITFNANSISLYIFFLINETLVLLYSSYKLFRKHSIG